MLSGNLDAFPLPDVLAFVAKSGVTGRLEIIRDEVGGEISVDQGRFVAACLAEDEAPTTVDESLDVAVLLLDGSGGTFQFVPEDWVGGPLDLEGEAMLTAVEKRRQEWAAVIESLGSLEDPLVLVPELPSGLEQVAISAAQWRLIALVDGQRSVHDIARDSASSVYATARTLSEMSRVGMVARGSGVVQRPAKGSKKRAVPDPEAEELLRELGGEEDDGVEKSSQPSTVRPLRAPTREEQRLRLRR